MGARRDDDIIAFIERANGEHGRPAKVKQTWIGEVAVNLDAGTTTSDARDAIVAASTPNWTIDLKSGVAGKWALFDMTYTVKGANADDAEQLVRKALGVPESHVAIRTKIVMPAAF